MDVELKQPLMDENQQDNQQQVGQLQTQITNHSRMFYLAFFLIILLSISLVVIASTSGATTSNSTTSGDNTPKDDTGKPGDTPKGDTGKPGDTPKDDTACEDGKYGKATGCNGVCPANCGVAGKCADNGNCLKPDGSKVITCKTTANWGPKCKKACKDENKGCKNGCKNVGDDPATYKGVCEAGGCTPLFQKDKECSKKCKSCSEGKCNAEGICKPGLLSLMQKAGLQEHLERANYTITEETYNDLTQQVDDEADLFNDLQSCVMCVEKKCYFGSCKEQCANKKTSQCARCAKKCSLSTNPKNCYFRNCGEQCATSQCVRCVKKCSSVDCNCNSMSVLDN